MTELVDTALRVAHSHFPVFACNINKRPITPRGLYDATRDPVSIREMFSRRHAALIAFPAGQASGVNVLDIDPEDGGHLWLNEHKHRIPIQRAWRTRRAGLHVVFEHASGVRNSAGKIAPGVDVRCEGGYVIHWPSHGCSMVRDGNPAPWPEWLIRQILPPPPPPIPDPPTIGDKPGADFRYARGALINAAARVASASQGARNDTLNREAFSLSRFVPNELTASEISYTLAIAARHAGLGEREAIATITSALRSRRAA